MLVYQDAPAALEFLCRAFGFEQRFRFDMPDGTIGHAELALHGDRVMLASVWRAGGLAPASELPALHCQIYCEVDDVDAHFARARREGATIAKLLKARKKGDQAKVDANLPKVRKDVDKVKAKVDKLIDRNNGTAECRKAAQDLLDAR